jgi:hypothetical protein
MTIQKGSPVFTHINSIIVLHRRATPKTSIKRLGVKLVAVPVVNDEQKLKEAKTYTRKLIKRCGEDVERMFRVKNNKSMLVKSVSGNEGCLFQVTTSIRGCEKEDITNYYTSRIKDIQVTLNEMLNQDKREV